METRTRFNRAKYVTFFAPEMTSANRVGISLMFMKSQIPPSSALGPDDDAIAVLRKSSPSFKRKEQCLHACLMIQVVHSMGYLGFLSECDQFEIQHLLIPVLK